MSLESLLNFNDPYSQLLNPQFNNCKITGNLTVDNLTISNLSIDNLTISKKLTLTNGDRYSCEVFSKDNTFNWIAGKFGSVSDNNFFIFGNLEGVATCGGHYILNNTLLWSNLQMQSDQNSKLIIGRPNIAGNSYKVNVDGDINITGKYLLKGKSFDRLISLSGIPTTFRNAVSYQVLFVFCNSPSDYGVLSSLDIAIISCGLYDIKIFDQTNNVTIYESTSNTSFNNRIRSFGGFSNISSQDAVLNIQFKTNLTDLVFGNIVLHYI